MNDLKTTSVLQKLYNNSTREGQVSLVSTHDVTNPPVHYCNWSLVYFLKLKCINKQHRFENDKGNYLYCICGLECKTSESRGMKMCRHCSVPRGSVLMITMLKDLRNSAQKRQSRRNPHLIHGSYHSCSSGLTLDNVLRQ